MRSATVAVCLLAVAGSSSACQRPPSGDRHNESAESDTMEQSIQAAQQALTDSVMSLPGVVGLGIGECEGRPCIKVFVAKKTEELLRRIPTSHQGFPVQVEESGEFRARRPRAR